MKMSINETRNMMDKAKNILNEGASQNPNPKVHTFASTREAYDECMTNDNIKDGDVLYVPDEGVVGFLYTAWPVAVVYGKSHGEFHTLKQGQFPKSYEKSVMLAKKTAIDNKIPVENTCCTKCAKYFTPSHGEYTQCPDCKGSSIESAEKALHVQ